MKKKSEEPLMKDHEYDGIHELDNPLPNWWLMTFYIAIAFSIFYFGFYTLGPGPSLTDELKKNLAQMQEKAPPKPGGFRIDEAELLTVAKDPLQVKAGGAIFQARCGACHGSKGEGVIGPNLTDAFWIHGNGNLTDIAQIVHEGVSDKGMPSWGVLLTDDELYAVTAYVKSLKGSNPPNPKAPQGNEVKNE